MLLPVIKGSETFAFCMCNPPFFGSLEEAQQNPGTAFEGTAAEMVCPGGELSFVLQMVEDSLTLKASRRHPLRALECSRLQTVLMSHQSNVRREPVIVANARLAN